MNLWDKVLETLTGYATSFGVKLLESAVLLIVGGKLISLVNRALRQTDKLKTVDKAVAGFVRSTVKILLWAVLIFTVLVILGIPSASLIAVLGSAGLAVGLALQGSLANFAGGVMILIFKPFKVGDYITLGDHTGTVENLNIFYTRVITSDNRRIVIPNGTVSSSTLENHTVSDRRRVDLTVSVDYGSDTEQVKRVLRRVAETHPAVLADPAPVIHLDSMGESSLDFTFWVWVETGGSQVVYRDLRFDFQERIKAALDAEGISIPFPQLDIHMDAKT